MEGPALPAKQRWRGKLYLSSKDGGASFTYKTLLGWPGWLCTTKDQINKITTIQK
jgi:hypothetical protein